MEEAGDGEGLQVHWQRIRAKGRAPAPLYGHAIVSRPSGTSPFILYLTLIADRLHRRHHTLQPQEEEEVQEGREGSHLFGLALTYSPLRQDKKKKSVLALRGG